VVAPDRSTPLECCGLSKPMPAAGETVHVNRLFVA
jgi:hypothetical protein